MGNSHFSALISQILHGFKKLCQRLFSPRHLCIGSNVPWLLAFPTTCSPKRPSALPSRGLTLPFLIKLSTDFNENTRWVCFRYSLIPSQTALKGILSEIIWSHRSAEAPVPDRWIKNPKWTPLHPVSVLNTSVQRFPPNYSSRISCWSGKWRRSFSILFNDFRAVGKAIFIGFDLSRKNLFQADRLFAVLRFSHNFPAKKEFLWKNSWQSLVFQVK